MDSLPFRTSLRRSCGTHRVRRGRSSCRPTRASGHAVLLVVLLLTMPIIAAANPVDPTWISGFYDDADTDQLVTQMMSPEGLVGLLIISLLCVFSSARAVDWSPSWIWSEPSGSLGARGPPDLTVKPNARRSSVFVSSNGRRGIGPASLVSRHRSRFSSVPSSDAIPAIPRLPSRLR